MPASRHERAESPGALRCTACQARLAHDQRYCVDCGARRGPLPGRIARLIALLREPDASAGAPALLPVPELAAAAASGPRELAPAGPQQSAAAAQQPIAGGAAESPRTEDPSPWSAWISRPPRRAAAVAVMAVLSFGVIVGSLVGGGSVESLAAAPLLLAVSPASQAPAPTAPQAAPAGPSSGGGGGGGSGGGGGGSAPATAPAATQPRALTVTVPAPSSQTPAGSGSPSSGLLSLPPIKHVFLIVLSNQGFKQTFGPSSHAGYLKRTLPRQGELLENYYGVAGGSLANEIALISGQGPTQQTAANCPVFANITPGTKGADGQVIGSGCVYPSHTHTLANQLTDAGDTWKAYVAGLPERSRTACRYPVLGSNDPPLPGPRDSYVTWSNPFVYFHSLTGKACRHNEVGIGQLATDLKTSSTTPSLSYIVPDACHNGSDQPCRPKAPSGLAPAEQFLRSVVPQIEHSAAYKANGLIAITFDQAPQTGPDADPSSCCDNPTYPNLPSTGSPSGTGTTTTPGTTTPGTTTPGTTTPGTTTPGTTTPGTTTPGSVTTTPGTANDTTVDTTPIGTTTTTTITTGTTTTTTTAPTTTAPATTTTPTTTAPTTTAPTPTTGTVPIGGSPVPAPPAPTPTTPTAGTPTTTAPVSGTPTTTTHTTTTTPTTTIPAGVGDGETNPTGGGGQVGLLLISQYVKPGSVDVIGYFNHFSLLATCENLFKLGHLGYTTDPALPVFDASVFNAPKK